MSQLEQRIKIKFCQKLGKTATETFQMMKQVYGDDALSRSVVFRWHRRFSQGRDSLEDDVRAGRPQTVRTERKIEDVAMLVRANRSQSIDDLAAAVGVSHGTCYRILTDDLNMSSFSYKRHGINLKYEPAMEDFKQEPLSDSESHCVELKCEEESTVPQDVSWKEENLDIKEADEFLPLAIVSSVIKTEPQEDVSWKEENLDIKEEIHPLAIVSSVIKTEPQEDNTWSETKEETIKDEIDPMTMPSSQDEPINCLQQILRWRLKNLLS